MCCEHVRRPALSFKRQCLKCFSCVCSCNHTRGGGQNRQYCGSHDHVVSLPHKPKLVKQRSLSFFFNKNVALSVHNYKWPFKRTNAQRTDAAERRCTPLTRQLHTNHHQLEQAAITCRPSVVGSNHLMAHPLVMAGIKKRRCSVPHFARDKNFINTWKHRRSSLRMSNPYLSPCLYYTDFALKNCPVARC